MHGGNGLKYGMLLYPDHIQNWLDYGYGLVIFLILVLFWLSETGQILGFQAFSEKPIEEMAWNFACWCILTTFRTDKIMVTVCGFFQFWCYFDLVKRVKFGVSRHFGRALWIFLLMVTLWLKLVIFGVSGHYLVLSLIWCHWCDVEIYMRSNYGLNLKMCYIKSKPLRQFHQSYLTPVWVSTNLIVICLQSLMLTALLSGLILHYQVPFHHK